MANISRQSLLWLTKFVQKYHNPLEPCLLFRLYLVCLCEERQNNATHNTLCELPSNASTQSQCTSFRHAYETTTSDDAWAGGARRGRVGGSQLNNATEIFWHTSLLLPPAILFVLHICDYIVAAAVLCCRLPIQKYAGIYCVLAK